MNFEIINQNGTPVALLQEEDQVINNVDDMVDLIGNADYQGARCVIIHSGNVHPDFFILSTRFAGEILQKVSNYRMKLGIVGDFSKHSSESLRDFIRESNRSGQVVFKGSVEEALEIFGG